MWLARGYPLGRLHWRDPGVGFARSSCRSVCLDTLLPAASEKDAALGRWLARELPAPGSGDRAWLPRRFRDWRRGAYSLAHPPPHLSGLAWAWWLCGAPGCGQNGHVVQGKFGP